MQRILQQVRRSPVGPGAATARGPADNPAGESCLFDPGEQITRGIWPPTARVWMAGLYVAMYIIRPWEVLFPSLAVIHFERIYALCMIGVVLGSSRIRLGLSAQSCAVLFFVGALTLSSLFAVDPALAWDPLYEYLTLVIFYFVLLLAIRTPYELVFMVICYVVSMGVYLAKAEWEFFVHDRHRTAMGVRRLIGFEHSFGGPNALAMSIVVSLPMLLFLFAMRKHITRTWPTVWRRLFPLGLGIYLLLAISAIILTKSRSGAASLALFVGLVAFFGQGWTRKVLSIAGGMAMIAVLWIAMSDESRNRIRTIWDPQAGPANATESAQGRIAGLEAGMKMFQEFPLLGVGLGNYVPYRVAYLDGVNLEAHNILGQGLGGLGLVGFGAFALMVLVTLWNGRKIQRWARAGPGPRSDVLAAFALACRYAILLLLFEGIFADNMLRFNWVWLAAFSTLALEFSMRHARSPAWPYGYPTVGYATTRPIIGSRGLRS